MVRNLFGLLLALAGAAAAVWSPFRVWYRSREGRDFRIEDLFTSGGVTGAQANLWTGLFLPMAAAAVLTLIAALLRSRFLVALTGLLVLGFTALWMVRQGQAAGSLTAGENGLGSGVGLAAGGGALLLLGALVMRGRRGAARRRGAHARIDDDYESPYGAYGPGPHDQYEPYDQYGPYGPGHEPRGAYQADDGYGPPPGYDATPPQEWDPWSRPQRPPGERPPPPPQPDQWQQPPPGPPPGGGPSGTQHISRRPEEGGEGRH